jgi:hypothetical protein
MPKPPLPLFLETGLGQDALGLERAVDDVGVDFLHFRLIRLSDFYAMGKGKVPDSVQAKMKEIYADIVNGSLKAKGILPKSGFEK